MKFLAQVTIHKGVPLHTVSETASNGILAPPPVAARPLLKWAGGKRQLLPELSQHFPKRFTRYVEAFMGSGAVFFDLCGRGRLVGRAARLADVNPDLIGCYRMLRDRTEDVIRALEALALEHRAGGDAFYYEVRDGRFNPQRAAVTAMAGAYTPELAAMLIFLNRTGFNGLFRLNRQGGFNVPAGRYVDPRICDAAHLRSVAEAFRSSGVTIEVTRFENTLGEAGRGDFVYCDPPYAPLSRTANFANYTAEGFTFRDQQHLAEAVVGACMRGALVIVSNSSAREIIDLYAAGPAQKAGLVTRCVPARRAINSRASARGPVGELIITNVGIGLAGVRPRMLPGRPGQKRRTA